MPVLIKGKQNSWAAILLSMFTQCQAKNMIFSGGITIFLLVLLYSEALKGFFNFFFIFYLFLCSEVSR